MTKEQMEVLNIVQQVLKSLMVSIAATDPGKTEPLSRLLSAAATNTRIEPQSRLILLELAEGMALLSSAGKTKQ